MGVHPNHIDLQISSNIADETDALSIVELLEDDRTNPLT